MKHENGVKYVLLGRGELNVKGIITKLTEIGYDGYLAVEWEKDEDPDIEDSDLAVAHYARELRSYLGSHWEVEMTIETNLRGRVKSQSVGATARYTVMNGHQLRNTLLLNKPTVVRVHA